MNTFILILKWIRNRLLFSWYPKRKLDLSNFLENLCHLILEVSNNFFHKWIEKRLKAYTFIYCGFIAIGFSIVACIIVSHWGLFFQIIFVDMYYHGNSRSTALVDATDAYLNYYPNRHRIPDAFWITPIDPNNIYFNLKVDDYKIPDWVRQIYAFWRLMTTGVIDVFCYYWNSYVGAFWLSANTKVFISFILEILFFYRYIFLVLKFFYNDIREKSLEFIRCGKYLERCKKAKISVTNYIVNLKKSWRN